MARLLASFLTLPHFPSSFVLQGEAQEMYNRAVRLMLCCMNTEAGTLRAMRQPKELNDWLDAKLQALAAMAQELRLREAEVLRREGWLKTMAEARAGKLSVRKWRQAGLSVDAPTAAALGRARRP